MSSGAIAMVGGGNPTTTMTVGVTNTKGAFYYGFHAEPSRVFSDEGTFTIGSLSPNTIGIPIGGTTKNFTVFVLATQNFAPEFTFAISDPDGELSATSVTSIAISNGNTVTLSSLSSSSSTYFNVVTGESVPARTWSSGSDAFADVFGTTEDATLTITYTVPT
jgi:hypothetical protein|tara:strand:+ start:188 stop:676 length:489 start_codon:yes stop_codon:yes gene_type:complete